MKGWREQPGPFRSREQRPASVAEVVRAVRTSLVLTHGVESLLLGVAGVLLARAAALLSLGPQELARPGAWGVALLCGALAAGSWWWEHPVRLVATARALDRRLRHQGALLTAFELEERGAAHVRSPMEELVCLRVLARLRPGEALRTLLPSLLVPIGAPVVAALALILVADARRAPPPRGADLAALADGLGRALGLRALDPDSAGMGGADPDGGLSRAQLQELTDVLAARSALPFEEADWMRDPATVRERVEEIDRRAAALAARLEQGSELATRLREARAWLDALRMGLADAGAEAAGQGTGASPLTGGPGQGTITGSPDLPDSPPMPSEPRPTLAADPAPELAGAPRAAAGVQAGSDWPAEYDTLVSAWVERTRAARAGTR